MLSRENSTLGKVLRGQLSRLLVHMIGILRANYLIEDYLVVYQFLWWSVIYI